MQPRQVTAWRLMKPLRGGSQGFLLCFWLPSCVETGVGPERGSHLLMGLFSRNFIRGFHADGFLFQFTWSSVCVFYKDGQIRDSRVDWSHFGRSL